MAAVSRRFHGGCFLWRTCGKSVAAVSTPWAIFNLIELYAGILGSQCLDRASRKSPLNGLYVKDYHLANYSSKFLDDRPIEAVDEWARFGDRCDRGNFTHSNHEPLI